MRSGNHWLSGWSRLQCVMALLVIGVFGFLTGCGSSGGGSTTPPAVTVSVTPSTSSVAIGKSQQFSATVVGTSNTAVIWSVTETGGGTVDNTGNYTAPMKAGTYHVVASSVACTTCSSSAAVTVTAPQPIFSSTPPPAAMQDQSYVYTIAASDPAGTSLSYTLTTAPAGATLEGNTVVWTPAEEQSRQGNAFTVTATSVVGGTATQSWSVAPAGTVVGSWLFDYWSADGTVGVVPSQVFSDYQFAAVVPQPDGSLVILPGTSSPPANWDIPGVPAGNYWMDISGSLFWTNTSTYDYGADEIGHTQLPFTFQAFGCNLTGLDPFDPVNDSLILFSVNAQAFEAGLEDLNPNDPPPAPFPATGSTVCNADPILTFTTGDFSAIQGIVGISPSLGDVATTLEFETQPSDTLTAPLSKVFLTGPALNQSLDVEGQFPFPFPTFVVPGTLTKTAPESQDFTITFSAWATAFNAGGPTTGIPQLFEVELSSLQQAPGLPRTDPFLYGFSPNLAVVAADSTSPWPQDVNGNNTWPQDGDFGTINFNNPFTAGMGVPFATVYGINALAEYSIPFPGYSTPLIAQVTDTLETETLPTGFAPGIQPVGNPQINGASLFTATTVPTVSPTLTWTAPTSDATVIYNITICIPAVNSDNVVTGCSGEAYFGNYTQTKLTVPPGFLTPGTSYLVMIEADSRAGYNPAQPNRYSLPEATATTVSAAITVSSSATPGVVHGDRSLLVAKPGQAKLPGSWPKVFGSTAIAKRLPYSGTYPPFAAPPQKEQSATWNVQPPAKK